MIVTVEREFGSGGRELGKRLSDALGVPCYDDEIIEMVTKEHGFNPDYVARTLDGSLQAAYPMTIGRRFSVPHTVMDQSISIAVTQRRIIEQLAQQSDCVIVGRCADTILSHLHPLRIFVYADRESKLRRCRLRAAEGEQLSSSEMERRMRHIDKNRIRQHEIVSDIPWGAKEGYDLCVNTSGKEIKRLIPALAQYVRCWFGGAEDT